MIEPLIGAAPGIASIILSLFKDNKESKELCQAIRDRLKREISFNLQLFDLQKGKKNMPVSKVIPNLRVEAMEELVTLPFPIDKILKKLSDKAKDKLASSKNKKHRHWAGNIKNEKELLERLWLRVNVAKIRISNDAGKGDVSYCYQKANML